MISFNGMALRSLYCADVPLRNCSLTQQISALVTDIMLSVALFFRQPEVFERMETTTSGIDIPVELIGSDIQPVVMVEMLNLSR